MHNIGTNAVLVAPHDRFLDDRKFQFVNNVQNLVMSAMILVRESLDTFTATVAK